LINNLIRNRESENYVLSIDESNNNYISNECEENLMNYLEKKYFIISTYSNFLLIHQISCNKNGDKKYSVCSKVDLLKNYLKEVMNNGHLVSQTILNMKYHSEYSRYEFIFVSKNLNMLVVGNRSGDIQGYKLEFNKISENTFKFNNEPIFIINCESRIASVKILDVGDNNSGYLQIFVLKINRIFESYRVDTNI
jgi:hypothetical protein